MIYRISPFGANCVAITLPFHIFWDAQKRPIINVQGCNYLWVPFSLWFVLVFLCATLVLFLCCLRVLPPKILFTGASGIPVAAVFVIGFATGVVNEENILFVAFAVVVLLGIVVAGLLPKGFKLSIAGNAGNIAVAELVDAGVSMTFVSINVTYANITEVKLINAYDTIGIDCNSVNSIK